MDIVIIGGGPAGLMAAQKLVEAGQKVTVYDRMPSVGRKLLMAGRGGLNLTHSEALDSFVQKYGVASPKIAPMVTHFPPESLRAWAASLGIETFVGSSGRVFPKEMKATPLLRAWIKKLEEIGVVFALKRRWIGWDEAGALVFETADGLQEKVTPQATLLALGGASWARLGSDGAWVELLKKAGLPVAKLRPSNCGFTYVWSPVFVERFAGEPIKPVVLSFGGRTIQGEIMITQKGIEGGAVYALSSLLRDAIEANGEAVLTLDLRPGLSLEVLTKKLQSPRGSQSLSTFLRKAAGLSPVVISLLRERGMGAKMPEKPQELAILIKTFPLRLTGVGGIERAISSAGGLMFAALDDRLMIRAKPGVFVAGEMIDWEAPTGGYLLQGTFSTAVAAAEGLLDWLRNPTIAYAT